MPRTCGSRCCTKSRRDAWTPTRTISTTSRSRIGITSGSGKARICGLDRARREITLDAVIAPDGEEILPRRTLPYDTLMLCVGSVSNDFGVPGAAEHPISLDTLDEAERFHRRLLAVCVRADGRAAAGGRAARCTSSSSAPARPASSSPRKSARPRARTQVTGSITSIPRSDIRLTLDRGGRRASCRRCRSTWRRRRRSCSRRLDVDVRTGERVTEVDADGVHTASGAFFPADLIVWAAGIMAPDSPAPSRRSRSEPRQSAGGTADAADDARSGDLRVRRLRGRTLARAEGRRAAAAARAGRASAGDAAGAAR